MEFKLIHAIIVALIVLVAFMMFSEQKRTEGYSLATARALSRYGYQKPPVEGYRLRARAYHSCDLPDNCPAKMGKIPETSHIVSNPFVWPYSGTATPHEVFSKVAPSGVLYTEDESPEYAIVQETDHEAKTV